MPSRPSPKLRAAPVLLVLLTLALLFVPVSDAWAQSFWDDLLTGIELSIGDSVAAGVHEEYGPPARLSDAERRWLDTIFNDIVAKARRKDVPYKLTVLQSDVVNAFAAPGGHIFLTTGLLKHIGHDTDAVANVIGHEIAHVEHKHGMNTLGRRLGIGLLLELVLGEPSEDDQVWHTIAVIGTELMHLGWSRDQEHESDDLGQRLAAQAGYDPNGMVRFFRILQELQGQEVPFLEFLSTHPLTSERVERAENRANRLTVAPRTQPPPVAPGTSPSTGTEGSSAASGSAGTSGPTTPPGSSGTPRVISRRGNGSAGESTGAVEPLLGPVYSDPAGRFNVQLPRGWNDEPTLHFTATTFRDAHDARIWIFVEWAHEEDRNAAIAVERTLAFYRELHPDFRVDAPPRSASLGGYPALYAEYSYTNNSGVFVQEGGYFLLRGDLLYVVQYADRVDRFVAGRAAFDAMAGTFAVGPNGFGHISADELARSPHDIVSVTGAFSIELSRLWSMTWERPAEAAETEYQLAEFTEIGNAGFIGMYAFDVGPWTTAGDTAHDWLDFLLDTQERLAIVEPVRLRRIGSYQAASFIVSWFQDSRQWVHYGTTIVHGGMSYEIGITYEADGFAARRPVFDRWLQSWRAGVR